MKEKNFYLIFNSTKLNFLVNGLNFRILERLFN